MRKYYLAYGSNLNVEQMRFRCPDAKIVGTTWISDYQLLFKGSKTGSYLTIEHKADSSVPAAVWSVSENDEHRLNVYEGFPQFYYKKELAVPVRLPSGETVVRNAFVYIMHENRKLGLPTAAYWETCLSGYRSFGFDHTILERAYWDSREGISYENE